MAAPLDLPPRIGLTMAWPDAGLAFVGRPIRAPGVFRPGAIAV